MELTRRFPVPDWILAQIGSSHELDAHTRLQMRIGRLDEVQKVGVPSLYWEATNDLFWWHFPIERKASVSWNVVVPLVEAAINDFIRNCTPMPSTGQA